MWRRSEQEKMRCSFCHKSEDAVGKLISSPSDYPRAYICDECIAVCWSILDEDQQAKLVAQPVTMEPHHRFQDFPMAAEFFEAVEAWMSCEWESREAAEQLARMRAIAHRMLDFPNCDNTTTTYETK